jgi:hypothetical protein
MVTVHCPRLNMISEHTHTTDDLRSVRSSPPLARLKEFSTTNGAKLRVLCHSVIILLYDISSRECFEVKISSAYVNKARRL